MIGIFQKKNYEKPNYIKPYGANLVMKSWVGQLGPTEMAWTLDPTYARDVQPSIYNLFIHISLSLSYTKDIWMIQLV